jgi:5'(3')-deoxyribonucleotidase
MNQQYSKNMLIKIDLDGVIRNWNASLIREYKKYNANGRVIYPFNSWTLNSSFPDCEDISHFFKNVKPYDIYINAEPYVGAIDFLKTILYTYKNVWIVSSQYENTFYPTLKWLQTHIPFYNDIPLVFTDTKGLVGKSLFEKRILIDDATHNLINEVENGGISFCFGQKYNIGHEDDDRWVNFYGSYDFSLENEEYRICKQYEMILEYLKNNYA